MTQSEANKFMVECFQTMVEKAQDAESTEEVIQYTDCAHKLFITLSNAGAFEDKATQANKATTNFGN